MASTQRVAGTAKTAQTAMGSWRGGAGGRRGAEDCSPGRDTSKQRTALSYHTPQGDDFGVGIDARVAPRPFPPRLRAHKSWREEAPASGHGPVVSRAPNGIDATCRAVSRGGAEDTEACVWRRAPRGGAPLLFSHASKSNDFGSAPRRTSRRGSWLVQLRASFVPSAPPREIHCAAMRPRPTTRSRTHALTHSRTHALTHSRTHALTASDTRAPARPGTVPS
jgi:hypothetical protein